MPTVDPYPSVVMNQPKVEDVSLYDDVYPYKDSKPRQEETLVESEAEHEMVLDLNNKKEGFGIRFDSLTISFLVILFFVLAYLITRK